MKIFANSKDGAVLHDNHVEVIGNTEKKFRFELDGSIIEQTLINLSFDTTKSDILVYESGSLAFHSIEFDRPEYIKNVYFQAMKLQFSPSELIAMVTDMYVKKQLGF